MVDPESTPGTLCQKQEYTLDEMPVHHHTLTHTLGKFRVANPPSGMFFGKWEEIVEPSRNPYRHWKKMRNSRQTVIQAHNQIGLDPGAVAKYVRKYARSRQS